MENNNKFDFDKICFNVKKDIKRKKKNNFKTYEVIIIVIATCLLSFFAGSSIMELKMSREDKNKNPVKSDQEQIQRFIDNYNYIINNYYKDIDEEELINGAIEGMMQVIDDPHSIYMDESTYNNMTITLEGSYQGLGVEIIKLEDGNIQVLTVFENSPAQKAGVLAGDIILSINGLEVKGIETNQFSDIVINSTETNFNLQIMRGNQQVEILVVKDNVLISSVNGKIYEREGKKIGYIYISIFANNTYEQFKDELSLLESQGIDSLIIDVRSNTGGHLIAAEKIASLFVSNEYYVYQLKKDNKITKVKSTGKETKKYPIVLLGDGASASASELLIGCLKDNLGATLIGTKTFGKGTVQELITLTNGDQYKITTKEWLTPNGNSINNVGIAPDVLIELSSEYYLNPNDENDNQLQMAIMHLTN